MTRKHFFAPLALVAALAGCIENETTNPPSANPDLADPLFARYVAFGNSITAGFQSGGINDSVQQRSYAVLLADQMGTEFAYPSLRAPGCPPPRVAFPDLEQHDAEGSPHESLVRRQEALCVFSRTAKRHGWQRIRHVRCILDTPKPCAAKGMTLDHYLDWVATYDIQEDVESPAKDGIQLIIHAAKGLEFPTVIVIGMKRASYLQGRRSTAATWRKNGGWLMWPSPGPKTGCFCW